MKKILLIVFLFCTFVFSNEVEPIDSDFKACYNRSKISFMRLKANQAIAVAPHRLLTYSHKYLRGYIKRDPFLGLYLFKTKKSLKPIKFEKFDQAKKIAGVISSNNFKKNSIISYSNGLNHMAILKKTAKKNSIIECVCCRAFGLSRGGKSFIDSDFILRFLKLNKIYYSDIGVKFSKKNEKIFVSEKNPFFKPNCLKVTDEIVSVDGKSYKSLSKLTKHILFSKLGKVVDIDYKRYGKLYKCKIKTKKKLAGGLLKECYLESIGLFMRYDLRVWRVKKESLAYKLGLKKGDKLMKIGDTYIHHFKDIKKALSKLSSKMIYMLFSRDDFQFFVHFRR